MTTITAVSKGYYHDKRTWGGTVPGRNDIADAGAVRLAGGAAGGLAGGCPLGEAGRLGQRDGAAEA